MNSPESPGREPDSPENPEPTHEPAPKRERLIGLAVVGVAFLFALAISWYSAKSIEEPVEEPEPPQPEQTAAAAVPPKPSFQPAPPPALTAVDKQDIPGFPNAVDPTEVIELADKLTPRTEFVGMVMGGLLPSGRVDLEKGGSIRFAFMSKPGEGLTAEELASVRDPSEHCGLHVIFLNHQGMRLVAETPRRSCRQAIEALPTDPKCTPKQVWDYAKKQGFTEEEPAQAEYVRARKGPSWRFWSPSKQEGFALDETCENELTGDARRGHVPSR